MAVMIHFFFLFIAESELLDLMIVDKDTILYPKNRIKFSVFMRPGGVPTVVDRPPAMEKLPTVYKNARACFLAPDFSVSLYFGSGFDLFMVLRTQSQTLKICC